MVGRFTARRSAAPDLPAAEEPSPSALEGVSWTVAPEASAAEPMQATQQAENLLLSDRLLDAKVRLHPRLIEEINLSTLDKVPEEEIRRHVQQLVTQYVLVERLARNTHELNEYVSEILDEMTGLGPLEPLLKDPSINDI
ncbi:MAG: CpaF family protein, partial [Pseudolabrys sp.]